MQSCNSKFNLEVDRNGTLNKKSQLTYPLKMLALVPLMFLVAFLGSQSLRAESARLLIDARYDFSSLNYNAEAQNSITPPDQRLGNTTFNYGTLRFDYRKQLTPELFIRIRPRLDRPYSRNNSDNLSGAIDLAYLEHQLSDETILTFGKLQSEIGGFEGNISSADHYHTSEIFNGQNLLGSSLVAGTQRIGTADYRYPTGVKLDHSWNSSLKTGFVFGNRPTKTSETENTRFISGVVLKYDLNEFHELMLSYYSETDDRPSWKNEFASLGWKGTFDKHEVIVDYLKSSIQRNQDFYLEGISAQWATKWSDLWRTVVKYTRYSLDDQDWKFLTGGPIDRGNGYSAFLEYFPFQNRSFRYHGGMRFQDFKGTSTAERTWTATEYVLGLRLNWDFLKD